MRSDLPIRQIRDLKVGSTPDLYGDIFADPDRRNMEFDREYPVISAVDNLGKYCIIEISGNPYVFPNDHYVRVYEET